jgi:hypothetical protein
VDEVTLSDASEMSAVAVSDLPRKPRKSRWQPGDLFAAEESGP